MSTDLIDYLYLEAKEKAFELQIQTRKAYTQQKQKMIKQGTKKLQEKYKRMAEIKQTKLRQKKSKVINRLRNSKLNLRNKVLIKLLNKTQITLLKKCRQDNDYYKQLLKKLILQALVKMMEPKITIQCLQRDVILVKEILEEC